MNKHPEDLREEISAAYDWHDWLLVLRQHWLLLVACVAFGLVLAVLALHLLSPRYDAYLQIVPVEQSGATVSRNLSGLASLAGINIRNEPISQFHLALEAMTGRDVAMVIAADTDLMARMFPKDWDPVAQRWQQPADPLAGLKGQVKRLLALPVQTWSAPDAADAQEFLVRRLSIAENKQRGIATLVLRHEDPALASELLADVYSAADAHLRDRMAIRTEAYVAYLANKLQEVTLAEHRQVLAEAMADQERTLMMARSGQPFASEPLGAVAVTDRPVWPPVFMVLAASMAMGAVLGVGGALLLHALAQRRHREGPSTAAPDGFRER